MAFEKRNNLRGDQKQPSMSENEHVMGSGQQQLQNGQPLAGNPVPSIPVVHSTIYSELTGSSYQLWGSKVSR